MANKADVKAMRARFQAGGVSTDETSSSPVGRIKAPVQPTLSGPAAHKKPVLDNLSTSPLNTKPFALKSTPFNKSDSDLPDTNKIKAMANRFANAQDDTSTSNKPLAVNKPQTTLKPPFPPPAEAKGPVQISHLNKNSVSSTPSEPKPVFPKPTSSLNSKPNWMKEDSGGGTASNATTTPNKLPNLQQKPISNVRKMWQQNEEQAEANADTVNKPSPHVSPALKPPSNFWTAQNKFNKEKDTSEQAESGGVNKSPFMTPPKPPANKKPSLKKPPKPTPQANGINDNAAGGPKRNPLPNSLALGPPPAKPNRPPKVDLENFKKGAEPSENAKLASRDSHAATHAGPGFKKPVVPTPPAPHLSNQSNPVTQTQPPPPALPNLPPRNLGTLPQEEVYDDVDGVSPPPLPSAHPSQKPAKEEINDSDDDGDMYEDLDERWEEAGKSQEKKKDDKEEKKRLEAAKKEQKEREKKEQDARKKFKLSGPLAVIQKGKALTDCKGGKTDLAIKQGEQLDIIRVQGNPEGKWLARSQDGSIGYVKTTSVEIDFNSLKNQSHPVQPDYDPEVYDDIDVISSDNSGSKGPAVVLPPLPGDDGEIYDDVVDPNLEVRVPPPSQFTADGNSDKPGAAIDEEIYDDVDSQSAPPLPPLNSLPGLKGKGRAEEMDPKKQKKFEKEEKDFRKKFKYEGEIQVLYQVSIVPNLNNKKWSGKELPVKAGEKLDVIVKAQDNKLICRNDDGKFGYVSISHIVDDGEIYDDIGGDECIYDND
ncbi:FYN-binding protein 1 isoform X2 [Kryptolebias marmoratus]|uniref:FYN-binding protein 1 isoform X2 n=1 Tax=Kryptolebias marmoratus TaxID=37003 RepID=UPI0007F866A9|nr:FYN-binding protein 1 isoform X2 [Kryptolebias marmoratus]